MLDINFDTLLRTEIFIGNIDARLQDHTRFWRDYVSPFTYGEIDDIFESEGRGQWADLDPLYAIQKSRDFPGKGILRRDGTYFKAATRPNHPGSIAAFSPTELVLGVSGDVFRVYVWRELPGVA